MALETRRPRIPSLVDGVDLRTLPLTPIEGFVVSRVDGNATIQDLADLTNLDPDEVDRIIAKLIQVGAVAWADGTVSLPSPSRRPSIAPEIPRRPAYSAPVPSAPPARKVIASESPPPVTTREPASPAVTRRRPSQPYIEVYDAPPADVVEGAIGDARGSRTGTGVRIGIDKTSVGSKPNTPTANAVPPPPPEPEAEEEEKLELIPDPSTVDALEGIDPELIAQMMAEVDAARAKAASSPQGGKPTPLRGPEPATEPDATEPAQAPTEPAPAADPSKASAAGDPSEASPAARDPSEASPAADPSATAPTATMDPSDRGQPEADAPPATSADPSEAVDAAEGEETEGVEMPSDGIELTTERRKRIDDLFLVLELLDHYEVLGIPSNADKAAVRKAYFSSSKVFHPDTAFRKNLGPYKAKMEAIFSRLTEAYEVLGKKKARADYDAYLASLGLTRSMEAASAADIEIPDELRDPPPVVVSSTPAPPASAEQPASQRQSQPAPAEPARERSEDAKRTARALMQKRLAGVRNISSPRPSASVTSSVARSRDEVMRELARSLKGASEHTGGIDKLQRTLMEVRQAENAGDLAATVRHLRLAVAMAPDQPEVVDRYRNAAQQLATQLADRYEQQATYEEKHRKWSAAALSWGKVVEGRPDDAHAHLHAANALIEAGGDLHLAATLGKKAVDLSPEDVRARRTLGRVYVAAGLHLNARRELEKAASLDPSDELVKNLLRDLSKS